MKKIILLTILICSLYSDNLITVKKYKYFIQTSTSLQDAISDYHRLIAKKSISFILDADLITDGGDSDQGYYPSSFETKDGYVPGIMGYYKIMMAYKNAAYINLQFGADNANYRDAFVPVTDDKAFLGRFKLLDDELDLVLGLNSHSEPVFDRINGVEYFSTTETSESTFSLVYSAIYKHLNLNMLMNDDFTPEQTIVSYNFSTEVGTFSPKVVLGTNDDFNYMDVSAIYSSGEAFKDDKFNLDASFNTRYIIEQNNDISVNTFTGYIELQKRINSFMKFSLGTSYTNQFSNDYKPGFMASIGLDFDRSIGEERRLEVYYGLSKNYYPTLQKLALIDQTLGFINVKIYM